MYKDSYVEASVQIMWWFRELNSELRPDSNVTLLDVCVCVRHIRLFIPDEPFENLIIRVRWWFFIDESYNSK